MLDLVIMDSTTTIRLERMLDSFIDSSTKLREEACACGSMNRDRCLESQRIAARLEPRPIHRYPARPRPVPPRRRSRSSLPARFAFYQGNF